ncbi:hypothetical protein H9X96_18400 [Pedobacter sp. N36a]|uniref:hypothetical protein n=1 Tax=Pedobacter sp. N36a TaxID=2767996 RepID=UPI001656A750|nr:hypothetical protein [Pedobacter sp. N36a]MBC8987739.1 hypothetical protein [Pedobacter sp. N36a]
MNKLNKSQKMASLTKSQELNLTKDILCHFGVGVSYYDEFAKDLLQSLLDEHNILDEEGNVLVASLDNFEDFGIVGFRSNYIDLENEEIPIFVIGHVHYLLKSHDWFPVIK